MRETRPEAATKYGRLRGVWSEDGRTAIYRGIPYAGPPVGEYRWQPPREVESWQGMREASAFSNACYHEPNRDPNWFYNVEYQYLEHPQNESEDCLYLNIWAPAGSADAPLPVAMWIHGGGFNNGYGHELEFDGEAYARRGVILVTINYRLGIFGFFSHPDGCTGNDGLLDQLAALKWVRENIADFGGDPENITIFGQSAGSMSVQLLAASPYTEGLFARAISQSGGLASEMLSSMAAGEDERLREAELLLRETGASAVEELRHIPAQELMRSWLEVKRKNPKLRWSQETPREDGSGLVSFTGPMRNIPVLCGSTANDGMGDSAMTERMHSAGSVIAERNTCPTYLYYFDRGLPGDSSGAFHSAELWYVFGTLRRSWRPFTETDGQLSERMLDYWTNFMRTGDPNGPGLPEWRPYTRENPVEMELGERVGLRPIN